MTNVRSVPSARHALPGRCLRATIRAAVLTCLAVLAVAGTTLALPTASGATPRSHPAPVTATRVFSAWTPDGAPIAGVTERRSGSCFTTSLVITAHNAYRCLAGNSLLDPCFARSRRARTLYCYATPWSSATSLRVRKPLSRVPVGANADITLPWAIRLSHGRRFVETSGTADVRRGVPLSYRSVVDGSSAGLRGPVGAVAHALVAGPGGRLHGAVVAVEWRGDDDTA